MAYSTLIQSLLNPYLWPPLRSGASSKFLIFASTGFQPGLSLFLGLPPSQPEAFPLACGLLPVASISLNVYAACNNVATSRAVFQKTVLTVNLICADQRNLRQGFAFVFRCWLAASS